MARKLGVALVGYGAIGRVHALCYRMLPLVYPDLPVAAPLVAVVTRGATSAERARRELGDVMVTAALDDVLGRGDIGIVDCCTPTGDHLRVAQAALEAGKALFCEKPLAATAEEAAAIAGLARERGLPGGVNFHFRWIPAIQEAHRRVEAGLLGQVYSFHLTYYRSSNLRCDRPLTWRSVGSGSGVLLDLGTHLIDLVLHLLGPVATVAARTRTVITERPGPDGRPARVEGEDAVWLQLELAGGGIGSVEASKVVPGAGDDLRVEAYGSQGGLIFDTRDPNGLQIFEGADAPLGGRRIATLSRSRPAASLPGDEKPSGAIQWYVASTAAFVQSVGAGQAPRPDLAAAARVQEVAEAARRSAAQGGAPVRIDEAVQPGDHLAYPSGRRG